MISSEGPSGLILWPPRNYNCSFCKREFRSAQALGGHMNIHRRDRARLRLLPPTHLHYPNPNPNPSFASTSCTPPSPPAWNLSLPGEATNYKRKPWLCSTVSLSSLSSSSSSAGFASVQERKRVFECPRREQDMINALSPTPAPPPSGGLRKKKNITRPAFGASRKLKGASKHAPKCEVLMSKKEELEAISSSCCCLNLDLELEMGFKDYTKESVDLELRLGYHE